MKISQNQLDLEHSCSLTYAKRTGSAILRTLQRSTKKMPFALTFSVSTNSFAATDMVYAPQQNKGGGGASFSPK